MTLFRQIHLEGWRQFARVTIPLDQQTTILAGSNGSGKTTILNILSHHFGWNLSFVSTPYVGRKRTRRIWTDVYDRDELEPDLDNADGRVGVGSILYENDQVCDLLTQRYVTANYELEYKNLQPVDGLYIPSHRPVATYNAVENIPTNPVDAQKHYESYRNLLLRAFGSQPRQNPGIIQKQSIIAFALFGEGNTAVSPNPEYAMLFEEFQRILKIVLPPNLGFKKLEIRMPEVVLVTSTGDFALDAMSGGINSLFSIVWQIFMFGIDKHGYAVVIDEPENHLHPSMQRLLLPNLAKAFPRTRFIVASHSPFIVSSFPEAAVYGLFQNRHHKIETTLIEGASLAATPNKILREILDVDSNLPLWVEDKIRSVMNENKNESTEIRAAKIMKTLSELGISDAIAEYGFDKDNAKN